MLLGANRRILDVAAAPARCRRLLTRWRCGGLALRRVRRVLGARSGRHQEGNKREDDGPKPERDELDGHSCYLLPRNRLDPRKQAFFPRAAGF